MITTYFDGQQATFLMAGGVCLILGMFFHLKEREKAAVLLLMTSALLVNLFAAALDPFLNLWDERFHALVAKNLMAHPFKPTLYDDPVVTMAYDRWDRYHIWLHKQPLFLWQIALSFKIFGVSEFSVRIPSAVLGTFLVLAGYRSGKLLVSKRTGFITGILIVTSLYFLELVAGRQEVDHNDVSFVVYISLSIWALIEYNFSGKRGWILLVGLFSGMAILCKWLTGLLVYLGWLVLILQDLKSRYREFLLVFAALLVTVAVALPWQLLTLFRYPAEAAMALEMNSRHFFESVDGHRGDFWYHFRQISVIYGKLSPYLMVPAWVVLYFRLNVKKFYLPLLAMAVVVYLFFSLATTKMPSFTLPVSMLIFIALASVIDTVLDLVRKIKMPEALYSGSVFIVLLTVVILRINIETIQARHTLRKPDNIYTPWLTHNAQVFKSLELPPNAVLFNVKGRHYVEAMFYTGCPAYNFLPDQGQYEEVKNKERRVAVFQPYGTDLPDYLQEDKDVLVLTQEIKGWE
ncbi:MAG TPA: glycosyltransferase family 39 protein [Bacteroidales bacterium]|nr:glycosyltransferase family 39 protein [Bacteroidales bacterium]HNS47253.1 glycosyltransferase family 39 protein [Bacteroidales bacterium]